MLLNFIEGAICGAVLTISAVGIAIQVAARRVRAAGNDLEKVLESIAQDIVNAGQDKLP